MTDGAPINPSMLRWARQSAGYSIEAVAERLGVKPETVVKWEAGEAAVTYGRVDALCGFFKRPSAVLYLKAPPTEDTTFPPDFRAEHAGRTPGLILQVRRAKERRELALELASELNEIPGEFTFEATKDEDPENVGARLRELLGVEEAAEGWAKDAQGYQALAARKFAAEAAGVLVFQAPAAEIGDASGFSIYFDTFPVAVLRASDNPRRRSFTLMHELAHLGLRGGGICDLHDDSIELYCNRVAAAALMAPDAVRRELRRQNVSGTPSAGELLSLAKAFSVSEQAMMLRLVALGCVPLDAYLARHAQFATRESAADGGGTHHVVILSRVGERFARLVLEAYHLGLITGHRASTSLGTNVANLEKIADEISHKEFRRAS
jgi:Zn-dependent peptidase ImmA (M78 family)/transcriptional regulator with XRE-family HTH domain